jgi:type I restriction enzyme S subunit
VYRISVDRAVIDPLFLMNALRGSKAVEAQLVQGVRGQTRPGINGTILRLLAIPIPPIQEQARIVSEVDLRLSLSEALHDVVKTGVMRSERLRQSVLSSAFTGQLVPQDPADEPASALLERIRAERVESSKKTAAGKAAKKRGER